MRATLVSTQVENNPLKLELTGDTVEELHNQGRQAIHGGTLAHMALRQILGVDPVEFLANMHAKLGGQTLYYSLLVQDGEDEEGLCDVSPHALAQHHLATLRANPKVKEVVINHGDCTRDDCQVERFYTALELPFPPPLD